MGTYELAPTFSLTMRVEDGQLLVQATNQPEFPVFPKSDTVFFYKAVEAELHFEIDTDGTATGVVLHQRHARANLTVQSVAGSFLSIERNRPQAE